MVVSSRFSRTRTSSPASRSRRGTALAASRPGRACTSSSATSTPIRRSRFSSAAAGGPLYAFKADGSTVPGWPVLDPPGAAYPALGRLTAGSSALDVVAGHFAIQARLSAYSGAGTPLPGWPRPPANYMSSPPTTMDVDGDGVDEIFTDEQDWQLHAYHGDATPATGWPTTDSGGGQERSMSAIADLDGDGRLDVIATSGSTSPGV